MSLREREQKGEVPQGAAFVFYRKNKDGIRKEQKQRQKSEASSETTAAPPARGGDPVRSRKIMGFFPEGTAVLRQKRTIGYFPSGTKFEHALGGSKKPTRHHDGKEKS